MAEYLAQSISESQWQSVRDIVQAAGFGQPRLAPPGTQLFKRWAVDDLSLHSVAQWHGAQGSCKRGARTGSQAAA